VLWAEENFSCGICVVAPFAHDQTCNRLGDLEVVKSKKPNFKLKKEIV
jgi:hypothetical protein